MSLGARLLEGIPKRPVILHVDINRTIIQVDAAGGKSLKDVLNNNLSTACVGVCDPLKQPLEWKPIYDPDGKLLLSSSSSSSSLSPAEIEALKKKNHIMTYDEFVDEVVAPKPATMAHMAKADAIALWKTVTAKRRSLKNTFCEPGHPGHIFIDPFYNEMHSAMLRDAPDGRKTAETHFVIPSFFALVQTLWQLQWPFHIVFRTFGRELKEVLREVEKELAQRNPALWGFVMRNASLSSGASTNNNNNIAPPFPWCPVSSVFRDNKVGTLVCHGADFSPANVEDWTKEGFEYSSATLEQIYEEFTGTPVHSAIEKQNEKKIQMANDATLGSPNRIISSGTETTKRDKQVPFDPVKFRGFVDHYPWWAANGEHESAGKVFPVRISTPFTSGPGSARGEEEERMSEAARRRGGDGADRAKDFVTPIATTGAEDPLQVFFDDNIYINDPEGHSIVDIRDVENGTHISDPEIQKGFLVRVDPRLAILDEYYFVRRFAETVKIQLRLRKTGVSNNKMGSKVVANNKPKRNPSSDDDDDEM